MTAVLYWRPEGRVKSDPHYFLISVWDLRTGGKIISFAWIIFLFFHVSHFSPLSSFMWWTYELAAAVRSIKTRTGPLNKESGLRLNGTETGNDITVSLGASVQACMMWHHLYGASSWVQLIVDPFDTSSLFWFCQLRQNRLSVTQRLKHDETFMLCSLLDKQAHHPHTAQVSWLQLDAMQLDCGKCRTECVWTVSESSFLLQFWLISSVCPACCCFCLRLITFLTMRTCSSVNPPNTVFNPAGGAAASRVTGCTLQRCCVALCCIFLHFWVV